MHDNHDSAVCVAVGGEILLLLELERLMDRKHFNQCCNKRDYGADVAAGRIAPPRMLVLKMALDQAKQVTRVRAFDHAGWVGLARPNWFLMDTEIARSAAFSPDALPDTWFYPGHHSCHALLAAVSSPLAAKTALVLSYDGGSSDGGFNVYVYDRRSHGAGDARRARPALRRVTDVWEPLGFQYAILASMIRAINPDLTPKALSIEGTAMAYAALGRVRDEWKAWTRGVFEEGLFRADWGDNDVVRRLKEELMQLGGVAAGAAADGPDEEAEGKDVAATTQAVFEETVLFRLRAHLQARASVRCMYDASFTAWRVYRGWRTVHGVWRRFLSGPMVAHGHIAAVPHVLRNDRAAPLTACAGHVSTAAAFRRVGSRGLEDHRQGLAACCRFGHGCCCADRFGGIHGAEQCDQQAHRAAVWRSIAQGYEHDECSASPKGDRVCTKKRVWFDAFDNRTVVSVPGFGDAHSTAAPLSSMARHGQMHRVARTESVPVRTRSRAAEVAAPRPVPPLCVAGAAGAALGRRRVVGCGGERRARKSRRGRGFGRAGRHRWVCAQHQSEPGVAMKPAAPHLARLMPVPFNWQRSMRAYARCCLCSHVP
jgi:hypothetical protein